MSESLGAHLGKLVFDKLVPFVTGEPLTFHSREDTDKELRERLQGIDEMFESEGMAKLIKGLNEEKPQDKYLILVLQMKDLLAKGKFEESLAKRMEIAHFLNPDV